MAIVAGQIVHASDLNGLGGLASVLTSDSAAVNNSTALVSTALVVALAANTTYAIDGFFWLSPTSPNANYRFGLVAPSGASGQWCSASPYVGLTPVAGDRVVNYCDFRTVSISSPVFCAVDTAIVGCCTPRGFITTGVTAGSLTLQFAQEVATAVNNVVKAGSWFRVQKLA